MLSVANQFNRQEMKAKLDPIVKDYLQKYYLE